VCARHDNLAVKKLGVAADEKFACGPEFLALRKDLADCGLLHDDVHQSTQV
jgi:hypothetical protein